jgi:hypothetical protein
VAAVMARWPKAVLQFEDFLGKPFGMFVATRCSDGDLVLGRPA